MAISGFGRGKSGSMSESGAMPSSASAGSFGNLTAFIDQGSEFEGKLSFRDTVRIDGSFSGEISSENTLIVGESGKIHANIRSVSVMVSGLVEGDIQASSQIVLHKSAVVNGDLVAPNIVMEEGAQLNGNVRMGRTQANANAGAAKGGAAASADKAASNASAGAPAAKPNA
ncbi:MAG: polymer-forming cytoskeletal protein [Myxococcota bacterium]